MTASEKDLVQWLEAARAGSGEALGHLLEICRNYLLLVANQELDSELQAKAGASDLVQETFLEAQRDFAAFRGKSEEELLGWLRQMLLNNVRNFTRHYRTGKRALGREVVYGPDDSSNAPLGAGALADSILTPSSKAIEREQAAALQRAIDQLPEDYRRVILLRFSEGKSFEEIGDGMKRSPDAVRKLWARAVERLLQDFEGLP